MPWPSTGSSVVDDMAAQLKLLVCLTVFGCLLSSASCENKKKIQLKVPHVVKHIHHTHFEPVHVHKIHHQKKNHHHKQEKKVSVGESGWESRAHETPRLMMPLVAPQDNEDQLLDSYEYGRESFWDGGDSQGKRRRRPNWGGSHEEHSKWSNVQEPKWTNKGQGDYGKEWVMLNDELPEFRRGLGHKGRTETMDNGRNKNGRTLSWRSNQGDGWKPITDYGHRKDEKVTRGKERDNFDSQYNYSGEMTGGEDLEYRQTEERRPKKGKKNGEKKPKWSKQIQEGELISEQDVQRIIESLQREQYQQQKFQQQLEPQQHQEYQQQQQISLQPTAQQQQHLPQQQQHLPQEEHYLAQQQQYLPQQQQVQQTIHQPVYRVQHPIARPILPQIQSQQVSQSQLPSWSQSVQQKKPADFPEPQHWTSLQTQPLTTHSPKMVWSGMHLELPQTTMWHVQQHDVGSTSGLPVQVISSKHPKPISVPKITTQPQTLASSPSLHQVLPPAGWPMNQKSHQSGVKQKWEQSVQTSGRDGPASSYKVEVINYMDNKRV